MPIPHSEISGIAYNNLFEGTGEMVSLMRSYAWASHPMGTPDRWPKSLRSFIHLMLRSDFPMFIWWSREFYMFHNDAYLPALGKKHPKALGAKAREMWSEIWHQIGSIAEDIIQGGNSFYAKELLIILDRKGYPEETYWTFSYSPAPNDNGEVEGIFCACNEVTESVLRQRRMKMIKNITDATSKVKNAEEAGQLLANALAEDTSDVPFSLIYLLNNEGSRADLIGMSPQLPASLAPVQIDFSQASSADTWQLTKTLQTRQVQTTSLTPEEASLWPGSESTHPITVVTHPILKPGEDKIIGFFVAALSRKLDFDHEYKNFHTLLTGQISSSLSAVLAREEATRQQEELIQLFQQAPVAIAILRGENLVVELANANMCEFWGRSHQQVINRPVFEALPETRGQGLEALLHDVLHKGVTHSFNEYQLTLNRKHQQEQIYVNFTYYPLRDTKSMIVGVIAIAVEVTEQVESRHQIEANNKELVAINADLDNFVYSASHDLKGPILNIEGLVKILLPKFPAQSLESEEVKKLLKMIFGSIDRLKSTIEDLSKVAKVQKEADEDVGLIDIAEVVKDVLSDMQLNIQEANADVQVDVPSTYIRFSPKNLKSVIYNLLSNAIKYRSSERKPVIRMESKIVNHELLFTVTDNGLGMDLKYRSKIFSMFKRLHAHVEGSGVGLYIVKRIVENAGGKIDVKSEVNKGAAFTVYLKLQNN